MVMFLQFPSVETLGGGIYAEHVYVWFFSHMFYQCQLHLSSVFKLKALKGDLSVTDTCGHLTHTQQTSFSLQ